MRFTKFNFYLSIIFFNSVWIVLSLFIIFYFEQYIKKLLILLIIFKVEFLIFQYLKQKIPFNFFDFLSYNNLIWDSKYKNETNFIFFYYIGCKFYIVLFIFYNFQNYLLLFKYWYWFIVYYFFCFIYNCN